MTLTERNQKLYELRKQLDKKCMELAWIETEITVNLNMIVRMLISSRKCSVKNTLDHLIA